MFGAYSNTGSWGFNPFQGFGIPPAIGSRFEDHFRCYPVAMMPDQIRKDDYNYGGKIFLPPSALHKLTQLNISYPMLFELHCEESGITTHSGVLEFVAEEGRAYLPQWMMETLKAEPGSLLRIASTDLPLGSFVKIEPQSVDFLDISDPKAVLENVLRKFSTLTVNDIIEIDYNRKRYKIKVLEVKPESESHAICVIETDLITDFAPPVGYVEPQRQPTPAIERSATGTPVGTMAKAIRYEELARSGSSVNLARFSGGQKLSNRSGKKSSSSKVDSGDVKVEVEPMVESADAPPVALELPFGQLFFGFPVVPVASEEAEEAGKENKPSPFAGKGYSLRQSRKRKDAQKYGEPLKNKNRSPDVIEID